MSADTKSIRIDVAGTVLSPARKFGGSYLCTMRAASEIFAADATRKFFEYDFVYELNRSFRRLTLCRLFYRVRDSAPDGSSPRDCALLLAMEDNLRSSYPAYVNRRNFCRNSIGCATALPMGVAPEIVLYCFAMEENLKKLCICKSKKLAP